MSLVVGAAGDAEAARRRAVSHPSTPPPAFSLFGKPVTSEGQYSSPAPIGLPKQSFTFETWIWIESLDATRDSFVVSLESGSFWNLVITPGGLLKSGSVSTAAPPKRRWTHIAYRSSPSGAALLVDGLVKSTSGPTQDAVATAPIFIGEFLSASLRQMRFWKVPLSNAEIQKYSRELPQIGDPRIAAWWPMDDILRTGLSTLFLEDYGPNGIHLGYPPSVGRWVRQEILEAGPFFEARNEGPTESPNPPVFIDFDGDGDLDLYTLQRMAGNLVPPFPYYIGEPPRPDRAFRNDGTGHFSEVSDSVLIGPRIQGYLCYAAFARDFTGDGRKDIFITDAGPETEGTVFGTDHLRVGTAQGTLVNESAARVGLRNTYDHRSTVGDIDGDGDLDVVSAGSLSEPPTAGIPWATGGQMTAGPAFSYQNNGTGTFTVNTTLLPKIEQGFGGVASIQTIDADLDGDLDLFLGTNDNHPRNMLALNNGSGQFTLADDSWVPVHRQFDHECLSIPDPCRIGIFAVPPADFDNDGILDLMVLDNDAYYPAEEGIPVEQRRSHKESMQLLLGNGDGTFRDASSSVPFVWEIPAVVGHEVRGLYWSGFDFGSSFDQNGDGWQDLIVGSPARTATSIIINRGSAAFEEAGDLIPNGDQLRLFDIGDIDADGDQDVAADGWILENLKPYRPNVFPQTNLRLTMTATTDGVQTVDVDNTGSAAAPHVSVAIPVPHGYEWLATDAQGQSCRMEQHVALCTRPRLESAARWRIVVRSQKKPNPSLLSTHAVASATADILDSNRTDNMSRVAIGQ